MTPATNMATDKVKFIRHPPVGADPIPSQAFTAVCSDHHADARMEAIITDVDTVSLIVRSPMIGATIAWAIGEALMRRSPRLDRWARAIWTLAIALALIHVAFAFHIVYAWSHEAAVAATARQTADRFGWAWRGGIYVNYVFLACWAADVWWWWRAPVSHASRSLRLETMRVAVFAFMFFNAAVVFASGVGRLVGVASTIGALVGSRRREPKVGSA
jgi:hypothetical protein